MEQAYDYLPLVACGKKPSFSTLVKERFYNDIIAEIEWYCRREKVDIRPISYKKAIVKNHDIDEHNLYFDVLVDCALNENGVEKPITMIVDAYFDLDDGFKTLHTRCAVPLWKGFCLKPVLPDDLIPVISKKELDAIAVQMINVLYPRVSEYADPISINQVVRRLRLSVQDVHFDSDEDLLAKIFFEDASTIIVDTKTQIKHIIPVSAGTILVNTPIDKIPDEHIRNNTIMHEVVHWLLHRPAFLLAKLWNRECAAIACRRPGGYSSSRQWTAIDRMEWQANSLAPRMLMPDWATRFIADGWQRRYSRLSPLLRMERTIDHLSMHFNVSRQLAKIRMEELGYEDAKTAFSYYDKRKHTISFENATRELTQNKSFRDVLETGIYAYVDDCFVIRDSKYVCRDGSGILHLTSFAKAHLTECCLAFASRRVNRGMQYGMLRYNVEDEAFITGSAPVIDGFSRKSKTLANIQNSLPASFPETLVSHMTRKGITSEQLAENTLLSSNSISRCRRGCYPSLSIATVVSLCIGLHLHPVLSMDMIRKAGFCFNNSYEHTVYQMLLLSMTNSSIYECNEFLVHMGMKPFGKEE